MKPQLHKLPLVNDASFLFNTMRCQYFDKPWHFHEEIELVWIEQGRGTKFIGDKVSPFREGELILIGPDIPHLFRNSEEYYKKSSKLRANSTFIHFTEDFLGNGFFQAPELRQVRKLLLNSAYALQAQGKLKREIIPLLEGMGGQQPAQRLLSFLEILIRLSESKELKPLLSNGFVTGHKTMKTVNKSKDTDRVRKVFDFIMRNYKREIYVTEIAGMLNMSTVSFSRYFKHHTWKTFSEYVTEVRISHACTMLMLDNENIAQISYSSGFENLSNFYKHFKRITGVLPKEYRRRFLNQNDSRY